jgi:hypothetical protein
LFLLNGEPQKMEKITENDIEQKARRAGLDMLVTIEPDLLEELIPSPFLFSLGVSLDQRLENLFSLVKASLITREKIEDSVDDRQYIPFMVVEGPFIKENILPIIVHLNSEGGGSPSIALTQAHDDEVGMA